MQYRHDYDDGIDDDDDDDGKEKVNQVNIPDAEINPISQELTNLAQIKCSQSESSCLFVHEWPRTTLFSHCSPSRYATL